MKFFFINYLRFVLSVSKSRLVMDQCVINRCGVSLPAKMRPLKHVRKRASEPQDTATFALLLSLINTFSINAVTILQRLTRDKAQLLNYARIPVKY